jgi:hypothetical protein
VPKRTHANPPAALVAADEQGPRASLAALSNALLYGTDHKLGLRVPRGGSACASCRWVRRESDGPHCANGLWQLWPRERGGGGGKSRLPVKDAGAYCCDLWRPGSATRRRDAEQPAPNVGRTEGLLRKLLAAAEAHGEESGVDYEAGDLRDLLSACWKRLSPEHRREVYAEHHGLHDEI